MKIKYIMLMLCLLPLSVWAMESEELDALLAKAAESQSNTYLEVRSEIVALGTNALPQLARAGANKSLTWQKRLSARICYERIVRGDDIEALRNHDWRKHPGYAIGWERTMIGPVIGMRRLAIDWIAEQGLWYYYIEQTWKLTMERYCGIQSSNINAYWMDWCMEALSGQPEEVYLFLAIEDRLDRDANMEIMDARWLYSYLRDIKQTISVPLMVRRYDAFFKVNYSQLERFPGHKNERYAIFFTPIILLANSSHLELLEKSIDERPALAEHKPNLEKVRARPAHAPAPDPAFRLGKTPVKIP